MKTSRFISLLLCVVMIMSLFTGLAVSASADDVITHEVQSGEIMLKICEKHGLNYYACKDAIMALNGFTSEAQLGKLTVGQKLRLPASDGLAKTASTSTAVVTSTTIGNTTLTTTTNYVGTTATGGNVAYYLTPYTVQSGDTLAGICNKLNSNYYYYSPVILGVNALANANYIRPGQVLLIPTTTAASGGYAVVAHTVKAGENMTAICNRYGISYQAMRTLVNGVNRRDNMDKIYVGQTVYVPGTTTGVAAATTVTTSGTTTTTTTGTGSATAATTAAATAAAATAGTAYSISFSNSNAFASSNGQDYVTTTTAGSEVSVWSILQTGYALKGIQVIRLDTGAPVPVDYNYFTMPNSNVYVEVAYEKGLTIQKEKSLYGSFDALVYGSSTSAAFEGDEVTVRAYPYNSYSVSSVSYQRSDRSSSAVEVKADKSGNYKFTMPSYPILLKVNFAPTQYHKLTSVNTIGKGTVEFKVGKEVVTKAEQGQLVTMTFVPHSNWQFDHRNFDGNLLAHMPSRNTVTSFQKISSNPATYSFVMGASDIMIDGAQFLNRTSYAISVSKQGGNNGTARINVIDQATGNITYNASKAKFGDTVQVMLTPNTNYVNDIDYMKNNSRSNGNLLPWGVSTTSFTMPDGMVKLDVRFIQDGAKHNYSSITTQISPKAGGIVTILQHHNPVDHAEPGTYVTISVKPNPNYALNKAKVIGGTDIWAVTLNGKYTDNAPASSYFAFESYDTITGEYRFHFKKSSGNDIVKVVFAYDYQGIPVKFQQVIAGSVDGPSDPPVKSIKNFRVNGISMDYGSHVVAGDTVSFTVDLEEGYEVVQVRKFALDGSGAEIPGTSGLLSGGSKTGNNFAFRVVPGNIHRDVNGDIDSTLVFEITAQQKAGYSYTVHYTEPMAGGQRISSFSPGNGIYYIDVLQTTSAATLGSPDPRPNVLGNNGDINDISANIVESDDTLIIVTIPVANNNNIQKKDTSAQKKYVYSFDKLLINGSEWPVENDGTNYIAKVPYPKDTANRVVTTELVYKVSGPYDYPLATLSDITIDNHLFDGTDGRPQFKDSILSYSVDSSNVDGSVTPLADATPAAGMERKILINGLVYMDYGVTTPPISGDWVWHYGSNDVQIYVRDADPANAPDVQDNIYKVSVNCGLPAAKLASLEITAGGLPATGMEDFDPAVTNYEAFVSDKSIIVTPTAEAGCSYTTMIMDKDGKELVTVTDAPATTTLNPGKNLVTVTVEGPDKVKTEYKVTVFCDYDASETIVSELEKIVIGSYPDITVIPGTYEYDLTVTTESDKIKAVLLDSASTADYTISVNGTEYSSTSSANSYETPTAVTWNAGSNTVLIKVKQTDSGSTVYSETTYKVNVTCNLEASKLATLEIDGTNYVDSDGQLTATEVKVTKDKSSITLTSASGSSVTHKYSIDGGTETDWTDGTAFSYEWKWEDDNATSRQLEIKVKETNKTETTYTLTITDNRPESLLANYLTIEGTPITFNTDRKASASPLKLASDVRVVLDKTSLSSSEYVQIKVNDTTLTNGVDGTDGSGHMTRDFFGTNAINWPSTENTLEVTVKYDDCKPTTYTVTVTCVPADLTLKEFKIGTGSYDPAGNVKGILLHDNESISAVANDSSATVTITVYGDPGAGSPFTFSATGSVTKAEGSDFHWTNTGGEDSNQIEVTVQNGLYSKTYIYNGKRVNDLSLKLFQIATNIYPTTGYSGITMNPSETITVQSTDPNATVTVVVNGGTPMTATGTVVKTEGTDFNWASTSGDPNTIEVTVTVDADSQPYTYSGTTA